MDTPKAWRNKESVEGIKFHEKSRMEDYGLGWTQHSARFFTSPAPPMDFPWKKGLGSASVPLGDPGQAGEPRFGDFFPNGTRKRVGCLGPPSLGRQKGLVQSFSLKFWLKIWLKVWLKVLFTLSLSPVPPPWLETLSDRNDTKPQIGHPDKRRGRRGGEGRAAAAGGRREPCQARRARLRVSCPHPRPGFFLHFSGFRHFFNFNSRRRWLGAGWGGR